MSNNVLLLTNFIRLVVVVVLVCLWFYYVCWSLSRVSTRCNSFFYG